MGNREILSNLGDLRVIAQISRGQPSSAWASCIGFALQQKWREKAAKSPLGKNKNGDEKDVPSQTFPPITRRVLLTHLWRSEFDPVEMLDGEHPERVKGYWDSAIEQLKKLNIVGYYKETTPLLGVAYGWQKAWLDQQLDIRPTGEI